MAKKKMTSDIDRLVEFLNTSVKVLDSLVRDCDASPVPRSLSTRISGAWREVQPHVTRLRAWLTSNPHAAPNLESVGLTGAQLDLKLHGFDEAYGDYSAADRPNDGLRRRVLDWMNRILGSLSAVAPGAEAVKEFKDALEAILDKG